MWLFIYADLNVSDITDSSSSAVIFINIPCTAREIEIPLLKNLHLWRNMDYIIIIAKVTNL